MSYAFEAVVRKIDINPYVRVPAALVRDLKIEAARDSGPLPVRGTLQGKRFSANVVKFRGLWRIYLNGAMRSAAGVDVGDDVTLVLHVDNVPRKTPVPVEFSRALAKHPKARLAFEKLAPYRQKEILRYLGSLKRPETLERNLAKVIDYLHGAKITGLLAVTR